MKRFGAHFLGGSTSLEKSQLGSSPELPSSGPQPEARHPKVQLAGQNPCAVLGGNPLVGAECQTCTGSVWFICSRMSWILLRIFFWWPAKVTPILSRSLETEKTVLSPFPSTRYAGLSQSSCPEPAPRRVHLLCSHLGHQVKGCKPSADKALFIPPHLDSI